MMEGGPVTCSIHSMVEGDPSHTAFTQWWRGVPSHAAFSQWWREGPSHLAFTQWWRRNPSHAAFIQWWRGIAHMQHSLNGGGGPLTYSIHSMVEGGTLTCSIHSMVEEEPLTCSIHSMVEGDPSHAAFIQWWRGIAHMQHSLNGGGSYSRVRRATKVKFFTPWYLIRYLCACEEECRYAEMNISISTIIRKLIVNLCEYKEKYQCIKVHISLSFSLSQN